MIRSERDDRVQVVTIDRPERRNAIDHTTILDLIAAQDDIRAVAPAEVRAVVITGAPPAFSAGADLTGVEEGEFARDLGRMLRGFGTLPVPVIAAIDGPALGAGAQIAVAVDLRVATPDSVIGVPAAKLGLAVDQWTIDRLVAEFGAPVARAMLIAAETSTAERLHGTGAIHRIGDLSTALEWARQLAALAPLTIMAHKRGVESAVAPSPPDAEFETLRAAAWASDDAAEGRAAFLEKRRPDFRAR